MQVNGHSARIAGVGAAFPEHYYTTDETLGALERLWGGTSLDLRKLARLHRNAKVAGRHLALPLESYRQPCTWGESNGKWIEIAEDLGAKAIRQTLQQAGAGVEDVGMLVFVSVTGIATPSIDARLVNRLGLPPTVKRLPLFGLGCVAGAAGLSRCSDLTHAAPSKIVLLLSVELCSLTFQHEDLSVPNLIASGIFGDGAAAVAVVSANGDSALPSIAATRSLMYPGTEHMMGWDVSEKGFRLILSQEIPQLIRGSLRDDVDAFLADSGLRRPDIGTWMVHSGGPKILSAIEEALELPGGALDVTWESLREVGNISSASVLHVLKRTMESRRPEKGTWGLLLAMGPGFCSEMILLRW